MAIHNWMGSISDTVRLSQLALPASHDAAVTETTYSRRGFNPSRALAVAQYGGVGEQLDAGSRFFDLRFISQDKYTPRAYHSTVGCGGWGQRAQDIFNEVNQFLEDNPKEVVILRITQTDAKTRAAVQGLQSVHLTAAHTYAAPSPDTIVSQEAIGTMRGKAIVAYGGMDANEPAHGWTRFAKYDGKNHRGIVTCGKYKNTGNMEKQSNSSTKRVLLHKNECRKSIAADQPSDHLCQVYWQLTGGNIRANTLKGLPYMGAYEGPDTGFDPAQGPHYNLPFLLNWLSGLEEGKELQYDAKLKLQYPAEDPLRLNWIPNVINLDFVYPELCKLIVAFNQNNLMDAGL